MEARWTVYAKRADFKAIGEKFNIDQVAARVIRNRDIINESDIDKFLNATLEDTHSPSDMADMLKGCGIMMDKIKSGKKVRIISDYDVDGVMSNYILLDGLRNAGAEVSYEIPDRMLDGYGINERIIRDAYEDGIDTIITCDNGIAAFSAIELAKELGMTIIVTDHHEVPYDMDENGKKLYRLVPADAVIDIKREDCGYPFKGLCGAGVAYKFIRCLYDTMGLSWDKPEKYIEFVAIATVCDVMELVDENRIYVKLGQKIVQNTGNTGLAALLEVNGLRNKKILAYHFGFVIGPCINATGRLESAKRGLELLLCDEEESAAKLACELKSLNDTRKAMTNSGVEAAIELVRSRYMEDKVLVVYLPELHESIAGIVAGKVREYFYKPVFVVTNAEQGLKGSGRSIEGYHMFDALTECKNILTKFGGHAMAAGFSLEKENLQAFHDMLNKNQRLTDEELTPKVYIDVPMPMCYATPKLVNDLELLEPFGNGNEKPLFAQSGLRIKQARLFGNEHQYVRLYFMDKNGFTVEGVDFNANKFIESIKLWFGEKECDKMFKGLPNDILLDVAYYPDINEYKGRQLIQVKPVMYRRTLS